ncbi:MAG: ribonuclease H-like domain-containing protein [Caldilineaceae bacterium]|nr:ribonuclease H-like domain-containing protein [Caldilineaceae bacterium]
MSSTLDRLRRLHGLRPQKSAEEAATEPPRPHAAPPVTTAASSAVTKARRHAQDTTLETLVPGEVVENCNGTYYLVTERYPLHQQRGQHSLAELLNHQPTTFAPFHPTFGLQETVDFHRALFIDTETTGLGGGAGVYAFMIGVGTFESAESESQPFEQVVPPTASRSPFPTHFVVRQYFMRNPGEEGAVMLALTELLDQYGMSVTFNGRTFDLPLLRTRLRQTQHMYPELRGSGRLLDSDRPHLDLLHPARRIWKRRLQSCRLINLEAEILGMARSEEDVPGHLIPQLYTDYLYSNNAQAMGGIFYHNREDIVSMVALATHLSSAYRACEDRSTPEKMHGLDWLSLGRCYVEQKRWSDAERALMAALEQLTGNAAQAEVFSALGQLQKQQGRWVDAAETWQRWLTTVPGTDPTPYIELAKYCEWQCKDLSQAEMWTQWALHTLQTVPAWQRTTQQIAMLEHRLARLQRKQQK